MTRVGLQLPLWCCWHRPGAGGKPALTNLLPLNESINSVPCCVPSHLGQGVKGWLLLCCCRMRVEALCWDLLSPGRRMREEKCQLAPLLTNWFHLIGSVWELRLSHPSLPQAMLTLRGKRNRSRVSTKLWWSLSFSLGPTDIGEGEKQSIV